jgi:hypothetical protein
VLDGGIEEEMGMRWGGGVLVFIMGVGLFEETSRYSYESLFWCLG